MIEWESLAKSCASCQKCSLSTPNKFLGTGTKTPSILLVEYTPSLQNREDPQAKACHIELDNMFLILDIDKSATTHLTSLIKCPVPRPPLSTECAACLPFLRNQVELFKPKVILCLGEEVSKHLIDENFDLETQHGAWIERSGVHLVGFFHPSELVGRQLKKSIVFQDLMVFKENFTQKVGESDFATR